MSIEPVTEGEGEGAVGHASPGVGLNTHVSDLGKVATGTGINFLGSIARNISLFLYATFLAAFLEPSSVGLYFLALTVMTLLATLATIGLDTGVVRFTALFAGEGDHEGVRGSIIGAFLLAVPIGGLAGLMMFLLAGPISDGFFSKPDLAPVLRAFAPAVPLFVWANIFCSGTQGLRLMQYQVFSRDLGEQLSKFVLSATFLFVGLGLTGVVEANVTALFIAVLMSFFFLLRAEPLFGKGRERRYDYRALLSYSAPLAISTMLSLLLLWTDTLFLGHYRSAQEVGIYSVSMRIAVVGLVILTSFRTMFAPVASDLFNRGEKDRLELLSKSVTKWILVLSIPVFCSIALYSSQVLHIMGSSYQAGASTLSILALGQLINAGAGPVAIMLMMCGRPRTVLFINTAVFVADIILCIVLIPMFGPVGAALASAIAMALFNIGGLLGVRLLLGIQSISRGYLKAAAAGALAVIAALLFKQVFAYPLNLFTSLLAFLSIYGILILWSTMEKADLAVFGTLKSKMKKLR